MIKYNFCQTGAFNCTVNCTVGCTDSCNIDELVYFADNYFSNCNILTLTDLL